MICSHCNIDVGIRNPSGFCDHLYYPDNCLVCQQSRPGFLAGVQAKLYQAQGDVYLFPGTVLPTHYNSAGLTKSVDFETGLMLKNFVQFYRPKTVVELGTFRGYSTTWLILGTLLNGFGDVHAFEVFHENYYGSMWYDNLNLPRDHFTYHEVPGGIWNFPEKVPESIDFLFHDTQHLARPTVKELEMLLPRISVGGVMVVDDMCYPDYKPMQEVFNDTFKSGPYRENWKWSVVPFGHGLGVAERLR